LIFTYNYNQINNISAVKNISIVVKINRKNSYSNVVSPIFFDCGYNPSTLAFSKIYSDPIIFNASSLTQTELGIDNTIIDSKFYKKF